MNNKKIVIVGATSAIAENCARLWVEQEPVNLTLIGRDIERLERVSDDLRVRSPKSTVIATTCNFLDYSSIAKVIADAAKGQPIDIALVAHGNLPSQNACQDNLNECQYALNVNGLSPALFAEAFAKHMTNANHGAIALIGSVAGDRGRKSNYVYGAAKGMLSRYAEGLQHRMANNNVQITLIKPGPVETPMTESLIKQGAKLASVTTVAKDIVDGIERGATTIYTPKRWRLIMLLIRHLPAFVFNKLNI